jgi:hypothetical protein
MPYCPVPDRHQVDPVTGSDIISAYIEVKHVDRPIAVPHAEEGLVLD